MRGERGEEEGKRWRNSRETREIIAFQQMLCGGIANKDRGELGERRTEVEGKRGGYREVEVEMRAGALLW